MLLDNTKTVHFLVYVTPVPNGHHKDQYTSVDAVKALTALYSCNDFAPELLVVPVLGQVQPVEAGVGSW